MKEKIVKVFRYTALSMQMIINNGKGNLVLWIMALVLFPIIKILYTLVNRNLINGLEHLLNVGNIIIPLFWFVILIAMKAGENLFYKLQNYSFYRIAISADESMMLHTMNKTASLKQIFFDSSKKYDNIKDLIKNDFSLWSLNSNLFNIFTNFIIIAGVCLIVVPYNALLTGIVILMAIPLFILNIIGQKYDDKAATAIRRSNYPVNYYSGLLNNASASKEIRLLGICSDILNRWVQNRRNHRKIVNRINLRRSLISIGVCVFELFCTGLVMYICATDVINAKITIGEYFLYTANFSLLFTAIAEIMNTVRSTLHISSEYDDYLTFSTALAGERIGTENIPEENITFKFVNVSFKYDNNTVLENVSFEWRESEKIALIGMNGSGKSTLIKLLCGLYECESGNIYINNINIKEISQKDVYSLFGIVYQDFGKYQLTLREILAAQDIENATNDDDLWRAFHKADCEEYKHLFTAGLDTSIGREYEPDGIELSGGQWQKIAIARNYFGKRRFHIFDEPASALDPLSEYKFTQNIIFPMKNSIMGNVETCLVISHRLSIGRLVDKVIFLHNGKIIEQGTHQELMKNNQKYAEMYNLQATNYS